MPLQVRTPVVPPPQPTPSALLQQDVALLPPPPAPPADPFPFGYSHPPRVVVLLG